MEILINSEGKARCIYAEDIDLAELGILSIARASHVEPDAYGQWLCDLSPVAGPVLGPFATRSAAIEAEVLWLRTNWLR